jgi:hypothetical protein
MALVYTHALPGRPSELDDLLRCQSRVACFGRVVAVAGTSSIDFYDSNTVVELSTVLDAGDDRTVVHKNYNATRVKLRDESTDDASSCFWCSGSCKLGLLSTWPIQDGGHSVDISTLCFLRSGLLAMAGTIGRSSGEMCPGG